MKLTAGKLRLAGWLIIADIVMFVLVIAIGVSIAVSEMEKGDGPGPNIFADPTSLPIILVSALVLFTVIYILFIFKEILAGWFNYDKANTVIYITIGLTFITAPIAFISTGTGKETSGWYTIIVNIIFTLVNLWLAVLVLKMPGDLFGYRKKIGVTGIILTLAGTVMSVTTFGLQANNMQGASLKLIDGITMLVGLVFGIYFVVILIRMFFKAARAVEQGKQAQQAPAIA